ncbi:VCBS domain-containing protein [Sulfuricurvum sp.]|uniref:VCBS domain-containing protein n=1 Tax=Sulfuricurvum sp. TaxID=2025608 RepID=UPI003D0B0E1F
MFDNRTAGVGDVTTALSSTTTGTESGALSDNTALPVILNHAPIAQTVEDTLYEDTIATGKVIATDIDVGDTENLVYALNNPAPTGLTFDNNGNYVFDASSYDSLVAGEEFVLTIPYTATDLGGLSSSANLIITIIGTNDQPIVQNVQVGEVLVESHDGTDIVGADDTQEDVLTIFSGNLATGTDVDSGETLTYEMVENSINVASSAIDTGTITDMSVVIDPITGDYEVVGNFNALAAGETATITFQYVANDSRGFDGTDGINESSVSEPATVTLTITGTNDQPIVNDIFVSQNEAANGLNKFDGVFTVSDEDVNDTHTYEIDVNSVESNNTKVSDLNVTLNDSKTGSYTVSGDFSALAEGETATVTFQYRANDGTTPGINDESNYSEYKTVTLTVTGTNDAPETDSTSGIGIVDTTTPIVVALSGSDVDGTVVGFKITELPANGTLYVDAAMTTPVTIGMILNGTSTSVYFMPNANYSGTTEFKYAAIDNDNAMDPTPATAIITVTPVSDMPTLSLIGKEYSVSTDFDEVNVGSYGNVNVSALGHGEWHTDNGNGKVEIGSAITYGVLSDSTQIIELEQMAGDASNLYTTMAVKEGEVYTLNLDYANRNWKGGDNSTVNVYWNGNVVGVIDPSSFSMTHYSITFTSDITGIGKLELRSNDTDSFGVLLDNVQLSLVSNTGYAGQLTNLPQIAAGLTDSSEVLSLSISGIPAGYILTDGIHTALSMNTTTGIAVTDWALDSLALIAPTGTDSTLLSLTVTAKSTESDGSFTTQSATTEVNILSDSATTIHGTNGDDTLSGSSGSDILIGLDGDDTLDGGAGSDALVDANGNDTFVFDAADTLINGGIGIDTLVLAQDANIDFTALNTSNNPVHNMEVIDLGEGAALGGNHTLTNLSLQDVIDMTDTNNTLTIKGDGGDSVNIPTTTGTDYTMTQSSESGLDVYTYSSSSGDPTVVLKIETDVTHS